MYEMTATQIDLLAKQALAFGVAETDGINAYGSLRRSAIRDGIMRIAPCLLHTFDFIYGGDANSRCFLYSAGNPIPTTSFCLPDGVHQGDVFGPIFFAIGIDQMLANIRSRLRDLDVESIFVGREVSARSDLPGVSDDGVEILIPAGSKLRLVEAPVHSGEPVGSRAASVVTMALRNDPTQGREFSVSTAGLSLCAEPFIGAYLDDVKMGGELCFLPPFFRILRQEGASIGLLFTSAAKNYAYVPLLFRQNIAAVIPNAVVVTASSPGDTAAEQLKLAARSLGPNGHLV